MQLVQRLRDQDPETTPAVGWLEERLAREGTTAEEMVRQEHQRQGATNVTVRNMITSMRLISDVDWAEFFESVSLVDEVLRAGSDFAAMDFATRDRYRTAIEELARGSDLAELEIARRALRPPRRRPSTCDGDRRQRDPGYYLIGGGRSAFERALRLPAVRASRLRRRFADGRHRGLRRQRLLRRPPSFCFLPLLVLAQVGVTGWHARGDGRWSVCLPAIDAALLLVNRAITGGFGATLLPGLELRDGVPPELRTLVAVPTLLTTRAAVEEQIERLEVHYLANPGGDVHFALLSDWLDADAETMPGDDDLAGGGRRRHRPAQRAAIRPPAGADRFLLLHRRRVWNEAQGRWMGWERKRGKLHELNRLLRGATDTTFLDTGDRGRCRPTSATSSRSTPTRDCRATRSQPPGRHDGAPAQPAASRRRRRAGSSRATASCSRASRRRCRSARKARSSSASSPAAAASTRTRRRSPTSTRTCSARAPSPARASTTSTPSRRRCAGRVPENALLSHDLFEGIFARAGPGRPTSSCSRSFPPATTSPRRASIAGRAATGSCCRGCSAA